MIPTKPSDSHGIDLASEHIFKQHFGYIMSSVLQTSVNCGSTPLHESWLFLANQFRVCQLPFTTRNVGIVFQGTEEKHHAVIAAGFGGDVDPILTPTPLPSLLSIEISQVLKCLELIALLPVNAVDGQLDRNAAQSWRDFLPLDSNQTAQLIGCAYHALEALHHRDAIGSLLPLGSVPGTKANATSRPTPVDVNTLRSQLLEEFSFSVPRVSMNFRGSGSTSKSTTANAHQRRVVFQHPSVCLDLPHTLVSSVLALHLITTESNWPTTSVSTQKMISSLQSSSRQGKALDIEQAKAAKVQQWTSHFLHVALGRYGAVLPDGTFPLTAVYGVSLEEYTTLFQLVVFVCNVRREMDACFWEYKCSIASCVGSDSSSVSQGVDRQGLANVLSSRFHGVSRGVCQSASARSSSDKIGNEDQFCLHLDEVCATVLAATRILPGSNATVEVCEKAIEFEEFQLCCLLDVCLFVSIIRVAS